MAANIYEPNPVDLPEPIYVSIYEPSTINRRFVLAINWLSVFMLGMFQTTAELNTFLATQLRDDMNAVIHGLWVVDEDDEEGEPLKAETFTAEAYRAVEKALFVSGDHYKTKV